MEAAQHDQVPADEAKPRPKRGQLYFIELILAFAIVVIMANLLVYHVVKLYSGNQEYKERGFAEAKTNSILEEIQSRLRHGEVSAAAGLSGLDDGLFFNPTLTIKQDGLRPLEPDHPLSGNTRRNGEWLWARRILVRPVEEARSRHLRTVTVRVFKLTGDSYKLRAEAFRTLTSIPSSHPTTQVFDLYLIALENVPGSWIDMQAIRPLIEGRLAELESRNPGLEFRAHWITTSSYGRNELYSPYINNVEDSKQGIPQVYLYPGRLSAGKYYYVPEGIRGRLWVDGRLRNGYDADDNPHPYALADRFNHAMRLIEERKLFEARVRAGLEDPESPTWRLLLEDMAAHPERYRNAIFVNLHGELLPMPPLRNYADPARSPAMTPELRVVTHPERLRYKRGRRAKDSEDVYLRVYAYRTDPDKPDDRLTNGRPICIQIMDVDLTNNVNGTNGGPATLRIMRLEGGINRGDGDLTYKGFEPAPTRPKFPREMHYAVSYVKGSDEGGESYTLIKLYNTPSVAGVAGTKPLDMGLYSERRLYGLEYIPCSTESTNDFATMLATSGKVYKNTARWRICVPREVLLESARGFGGEDRVLEVRTRISDDLRTGQVYPTPNDPENLSRTYVYLTSSLDAVPFTERYQFLGDPRHLPYADLKDRGVSFPNGYNWYFDDFKDDSVDAQRFWEGFSRGRLKDGWMGRIEADYPRFAQLLRTALCQSSAVWTSVKGVSFSYLGLGNEIGTGAGSAGQGDVVVSLQPYGGRGHGPIDNMNAGGGDGQFRFLKLVRQAGDDNYWWGRHWLGDLYPDSAYASWLTHGNLPAGKDLFFRVRADEIKHGLPVGTTFKPMGMETAFEGSTSFFNFGTTWSTFHHQVAEGAQGAIRREGKDLAESFQLELPKRVSIGRPFRLDTSWHGTVGSEWHLIDDYPRFTGRLASVYYRHDRGGLGSALIALSTPKTGKTAHILLNALDDSMSYGPSASANHVVAAAIQAYFEAANPQKGGGYRLPPRVEILSPTEDTEVTDPSRVPIHWMVQWRRWDGGRYGPSFGEDYAQSEEELEYSLLYSTDGGMSFHYVQDGELVRPRGPSRDPKHRIPDAGEGRETYTWVAPKEALGGGTCILRVEAFLKGRALHYSYHQVKFSVRGE